ncbi:S8 family serine peptidase [Solirubrobacter ginsenosidimutans]|uniref:S8 family serine peptidase n=1 Tax=Solirubrobacter ginsenosidimutans TaxID=490573 RepID=A0A9X3MTA7_9ACTN|nr:S8 family serine peptidase [Solirubrobacter ginsenosidimutans]MDA0159278.1 S8 family serine peptidase [Solirubrobacter ginsenosidimutans]
MAAVLALGGAATAATSRHDHVFRGKRTVLSAADIKRLSAGTRRPSIIIFKNQLKNLPATASAAAVRAKAASVLQAPVRAQLARVHATHVNGFRIINAIAASITPAEAQHLRADTTIQAVVPDTFRHFATLDSGPGPAAVPEVASTGQQPICPSNPSEPIIEPEARTVMNVPAAQQLVDGSGIRVGIVADGLDPNNPDLIRPNGQHVIFDYQDFSGFGTSAPSDGRESFLDAGTIASQGNQTYDISGFVNPAHPLPPGCNIKIAGIAPGASLAVINLSGPNAGFFNSTIVQGIEWAVLHDHVNVLNESIGGNPLPNTENDPVALADQAAVAAGVTVVASSGDAGPFNNVGSPATTPGVIAVGGTTTYRVYRQTTRYGTQLVPGGWENNNITALSSDGIDEFNPDTVDVVAPGDRGWSLCSSDTKMFFGCTDIDKGANPPPIWAAGGTSASAPETSGTAALVLQAYAKTHGRLPAPALVEQIITSTATDLGAPADRQGAGLVNTLKAVQLAESIDRGANQGQTLLIDQKSLNATLNAGQSHTFTVHATNEGSTPQTVSPSVVGRPTPLSDDTGAVTLSNASPTYIDGEGNTDFYAVHTFNVGPGADYLTGDITWNAASKGTAVFETLFDPQGQVAAYSLIGSDQSGFGHVEVRKPNAGKWTAVIFTVNNAAVYSGQVQFNYEAQAFHGAGSVAPAAQTLAPGQTGSFNVTVGAGQAGDEGLRLHMGTGGSDDGSIPIIIRSLVPLGRAGGTFAGTLTGGGSTGNAGQQFTYQFNVPNGEPSLNAALQLTDNNYQLTGYLVDPSGQPVSEQSNAVFDASDNLLGFGQSMQFFHGSPQGGLWTLTLLVSGPVAGQHLREPFTGAITFAAPPVTSKGIPGSSSSVVKAKHPVTATIKITNTGSVRKDYFADARLNGKTQQVLLGSDANAVGLPLSLSAQPNWLVPTNTDAFSVLAKGTIPITTEISFFSGDPDALGGSIGNASGAKLTAPELAPGFYFDLPEPTGPFGPTGVPAGSSVDLVGIADSNPFDTNVTASSGDVWQQSVDATAPYTPLSLAPGQTGTITLTFNAAGHKGKVLRGFVDVDTFNLASLGGDKVTTIPYTYKLG